MTSAAIESILVLIGLEPVALVLGPILAGETYDLTQLCGGDPPSDPGLTGQDVIDCINFADPLVSIPAIAKAKQWFEHYYWYVACQCTGGGTMPAPPALSNPGNPTGTNTGLPDARATGPCWDVTRSINDISHATLTYLDQTGTLLPQVARHTVTGSFAGIGNSAETIPAGASTFKIVLNSGGTAQPSNCDIVFYNSAGANVGGMSALIGATGPDPATATLATIPAGALYWQCAVRNQTNTAATWVIEVSFSCSGSGPTSLNNPCCPPDPLLVNQLNQILGMVTLMQRQIAPFAYVPGIAHTGLSGDGQISVHGLIGAKVNPTSIPPDSGLEVGNPDELWLDSWINWGNADGWTAREFLRSAPYVTLPPLAGQFTKIGYSLRPGLTVDLTELSREP